MLIIKLYGKRTSGYSFVKKHIIDFLIFNNLSFDLIEYNNVIDFIDDQINSIPCVIINNGPKIEVSKQESIKKAIQLIYHAIVDNVGINHIRKIIIPFDYSKASLNAFHQSKNVLLSNHYSIYLLFMPDQTISNEDACNADRFYSNEMMREISEKLEDDYIGNIANITPIFSSALTRCQWPAIFDLKSEEKESIVLYNYNSQLISFNNEVIDAILKSKQKILLIFDSSNLDHEKGIKFLLNSLPKAKVLEPAFASKYAVSNFPSEVDLMISEPMFTILDRSSFMHSSASKIALLKKCLKNETPLLII